MGDELVRKVEQLAAEHAVPDEAIEPTRAEPLTVPRGIIDVVFEVTSLIGGEVEGLVYKGLRDANGFDVVIGHWLPAGHDDERVLRLPFQSTADQRAAEQLGPDGTVVVPAHELVNPKGGTVAAAVLGTFIASWRAGEPGLTDKLMGDRMDRPPSTVGPRRKNLLDDGWLEATGTTVEEIEGHPRKVYRLSPAAVEKLNLRRTAE